MKSAKAWVRTAAAVAAAVLLAVFWLAAAGATYTKLPASDVQEIQRRLKAWGYYSGEVDGIYGDLTYKAVRYFQSKNGLSVDGFVGNKTAEKLGIQLSNGKDEGADTYLLAKLVYAEARGEPYQGKVAVAAVVLNRVKSAEFPNSISGVIYQPGAFSVVSDGQISLSPDAEALRAAKDALAGADPTGGCLFYYNPKKTSNSYMLSKPVALSIGNHNFCY